MNWIFCAIGVMIFSIFTYLFIRLAKNHSIGIEIQNFASCIISVLFFLSLNLINNTSLIIDIKYLIIISLTAIFFMWIANVMSLKAMQLAPNAGYSLIITKSNVIFVTLLSVLLFNSQITVKSIIAIIFILIFNAYMILEENKKENNNKTWLIYSSYHL